jgi:hypothetical protein
MGCERKHMQFLSTPRGTTSLGGDYPIVLPILRSLYESYGRISVIPVLWSPQEPLGSRTAASFVGRARRRLLLITSVYTPASGVRWLCVQTWFTGCNCAHVVTSDYARIAGLRFTDTQDDIVGIKIISIADISVLTRCSGTFVRSTPQANMSPTLFVSTDSCSLWFPIAKPRHRCYCNASLLVLS